MDLETFLQQHDASVALSFNRGGYMANIITFHSSTPGKLDVEWFYALPEVPFSTLEEALNHLREVVENAGEKLVLVEVKERLLAVIQNRFFDPWEEGDMDLMGLAQFASLLPAARAEAFPVLQQAVEKRFHDRPQEARQVFMRFWEIYQQHAG